MPTLPTLRPASLPAWSDTELDEWRPLATDARAVAVSAGLGKGFEMLVTEVRELVDRDYHETIESRLGSRRFARALVMVWAGDPVRARRSMSPALLDALVAGQSESPSRLVATALAGAFLDHFDRLDRWRPGLVDAVRGAVVGLVRALPERTQGVDLVEAARHRGDVLLSRQGPRRLARELVASQSTPRAWLRSHGASGYDRGRYGVLLRHAVYLERIAAADHTDQRSDAVLTEIQERELLEAPGNDALSFGHEALMVLADKPDAPPSDAWLETILEIAGDPRQTGTATWHRWWEPIPETLRDRVVRWMSAEDLKLFLRAVEDYGYAAGHESIIRMFPRRKTFLWGLHDQGLVKETRLILGSSARDGIVRQLGPLRTDTAILTERRDTSVIVIDCGSFHIVEGSHSFRMWIYAGRPVGALIDRSHRQFSPAELIETIPAAHAASHPGGELAHVDVAHQGLWQAKALDFLVEELGVAVDLGQVLSADDLYDLRFKKGLPVRGSRRRAWA